MSIIDRAWTCINRWKRRGYDGQTAIFEEIMGMIPQWQPIETAPMDVDVLLFEPDCSIFVGSGFAIGDVGSYWCAWGGPRREPTHWMPLPEPPK